MSIKEKGMPGKKKKEKVAMTTIKIAITTRDKIMTLGKMGDTYDTVLTRLLGNGAHPEELGEPRDGH